MYNTVEALCTQSAQVGRLDEFCPLFTTKRGATKYARRVASNYGYAHQAHSFTDSKGNVIVHGDSWVMAVMPITIRDKEYYEVAKAIDVSGNANFINIRVPVLSIFEDFQGIRLSSKDVETLSRFDVDVEGNVFRDGKIYKPQRSFSTPDCPYYHVQVEMQVHKVREHRLSHIVWAVFNGARYDSIKLMTSAIAQFCPAYLSTTDKHQLEILALRNMGWQWCIDHIDADTSNNSFANLQMCTIQANNKLRDIRRELHKSELF